MPVPRRISAKSNQNIWVSIRSAHPFFPDDDLSAYNVEVAITIQDPVEEDWQTAAWESGTKEINGREYYEARLVIGPGSGTVILTGDETYQVHVRLTTAGEVPVVEAGTLYAY